MTRTKKQPEKAEKALVKFTRNHGAYTVNDIAGFEPEVAERLKKINVAVEYDPDAAPDVEEDGNGGDANTKKDGAQ